jgi:hypothetical protein
MSNEINAIELTDEQLDVVAGGATGNTSTQIVGVNGSTTGVIIGSRNATVNGGTTAVNTQSFQAATDSHNLTQKTLANIFSFNTNN